MKNSLPRRTWLLFILLSTAAIYADGILQQRLSETRRLARAADIAVCEEIAKSRKPENDKLAARLAISIGNDLNKYSDPKMKKLAWQYIEVGLCLDLELFKKYSSKTTAEGASTE